MVHNVVRAKLVQSLCRPSQTASSLLPFLYETRTLSQSPNPSRARFCQRPIQRSIHISQPALKRHNPLVDENDEFGLESTDDLDVPFESKFDALDGDVDSEHPGSTITTSERATFVRIFNDIMKGAESRTSNNPFDLSMQATRHEEDTLDDIFLEAQAAQKETTILEVDDFSEDEVDYYSFKPKNAATSSKARPRPRKREEALSRFPVSLRGLASRTSQTLAQALEQRERERHDAAVIVSSPSNTLVTPISSAPSPPASSTSDNTSIERTQELERIEGLLRTARTDADVWTVLETHVFSMIGSMTLDRLPIVGPTYPGALLLAMRILRVDFAAPDACIALFERVKTLHPLSEVLGVTTMLYNELMYVYWKAFGDFDAVADLLDDMDRGGTGFDARTAAMLHEIKAEHQLLLRQRFASIWGMQPVQAGYARVMQRLEQVVRALRDREVRDREERHEGQDVGFA
ncbi:MAG: hypothetical protein M1825_004981 [Sarcosagium campestre]|nr:MAG: hypothetical protein M1825_004981 [Sarcosagium campestre]